MTDAETIAKLKEQRNRARKRLREKMRYERMMLINAGSTPQYISEIERKDKEALED